MTRSKDRRLLSSYERGSEDYLANARIVRADIAQRYAEVIAKLEEITGNVPDLEIRLARDHLTIADLHEAVRNRDTTFFHRLGITDIHWAEESEGAGVDAGGAEDRLGQWYQAQDARTEEMDKANRALRNPEGE